MTVIRKYRCNLCEKIVDKAEQFRIEYNLTVCQFDICKDCVKRKLSKDIWGKLIGIKL